MPVRKEEKVLLSAEEARECLALGDRIHTYMNPGGMLVGADWDRSELLALIDATDQREIGGEACRRMKHALVLWRGADPLFVEHDEAALARLEALATETPKTPEALSAEYGCPVVSEEEHERFVKPSYPESGIDVDASGESGAPEKLRALAQTVYRVLDAYDQGCDMEDEIEDMRSRCEDAADLLTDLGISIDPDEQDEPDETTSAAPSAPTPQQETQS